MTKALDFYWKTNRDWWHVEGFERVINEDAPKEAKESYNHYLKQRKRLTRNRRIL